MDLSGNSCEEAGSINEITNMIYSDGEALTDALIAASQEFDTKLEGICSYQICLLCKNNIS